MTEIFDGKLGVLQRVKPSYRVPFFDCLAARCSNGMALFAGEPLAMESIATDVLPTIARLEPVNNIHLFDPSSPFYACYQQNLFSRLREWNPDALIVEANYRYLSSGKVIRWMRSNNRPVVGWGLGAKSLPTPLRQVRDSFLKQFDAMIAYSENGAEEYARLGIPTSKIIVARNAVTDAPSGPEPVRQAGVVKGPVVLFVGRLQERKRVGALIEAIARIPERIRPGLMIVGDGPESESLRLLAQERLPSTVFAGYQDGERLADHFRQADLFVLPGTGGLAIQQAMSFGLPLIVAEGDGTERDLVTTKNGWLVEPGNDEQLFSTLLTALQDPARLLEMGRESYRIVKTEINIQAMANNFIHAINIAKK